MIDRNTDLQAFQTRAIGICGEFASITAFAGAMQISRDVAYDMMRGLRKVGRCYMVADMAERLFDELHPKPKRLG